MALGVRDLAAALRPLTRNRTDSRHFLFPGTPARRKVARTRGAHGPEYSEAAQQCQVGARWPCDPCFRAVDFRRESAMREWAPGFGRGDGIAW
jgi:hypothetical protein